MSLIELQSKQLRIPFQDIKEATHNFTTLIGRGGYGPVYRGQLSISGKPITVALKRLQIDNLSGQGLKEFLTEIHLLSRYKHQNLVSLVGFCEQGNEKFLIYDYAQHGSLDRHLKPYKTRCPLPWKKRIEICIDAARGLDHLHNHVAPNQRVIHRDIKSANILLDHNWKAMIADFGLSKLGRANENDTYLITNACGTHGYCDPAYIHTGILTKESDVYSFGVVLLEVVCGRLCFINVDSKERFLATLAQRYYEQKKLNLIIDRGLREYMCSDSMKEFLEIAFHCLHDDRKQRPSMGLVLQKLEKALKLLEMEEAPELLEIEEALELRKLVETLQLQQFEAARELQELEEAMGLNKLVETLQIQQFKEAYEMQKLEEALGLPKLVEALKLHEFEEALKLQVGESGYEVIKAAYDMLDTPLSYIARYEVYSRLSSGIFVDHDSVWLSMDGDGKTQEMISALKFMPLYGDQYGTRYDPESRFRFSETTTRSDPESRFPNVAEVRFKDCDMNVTIRTQFLASDVRYAVYFICKPIHSYQMIECIMYSLRYKLSSTNEEFKSYPSKMEGSGWWMFELFQTRHHKPSVDFEVTFLTKNEYPWSHLCVEGISFLPVPGHKFEDEEEIEKLGMDKFSTPNIEWDDQLPSDYKQFLYYSNKEMMKKSQGDVIFPAKEEAYFILSSGVLIKINHKVNMWFWITKLNGKKCIVLPPRLLCYDKQPIKITRRPSNESRTKSVVVLQPPSTRKIVSMDFQIPDGVLSTNTTYGIYLVYKLPEPPHDSRNVVVMMRVANCRDTMAYVNIPQIPVYVNGTVCNYANIVNKSEIMHLPRERKDGWMEVHLEDMSHVQLSTLKRPIRKKSTWESCFLPCTSDNNDMDNRFTLDPCYFSHITIKIWDIPPEGKWSLPLFVQGMELRPVSVVPGENYVNLF